MPSLVSRLSSKSWLLPAIAVSLAGPVAFGQITSVPNVVSDAQVPYNLTLSLSNPTGVAVGSDGTVYVADTKNNRVVRVASTGALDETLPNAAIDGTVSVLTPPASLRTPNAVAVDATGCLYFSDIANNLLYRVTNPGSASPTYTALSYAANQTPSALATDSAGNLWVADAGLSGIYEVAAGATTGTATALGSLVPTGIAVSSSGVVYFAEATNHAIYKLAGSTPTQLIASYSGSNFNFNADRIAKQPTGMGFDPAGNLYFMDSSSSRIVEINPTNAALSFLVPFQTAKPPQSLAVGPTGNVYLTSGASLVELFYNGNSVNFGSIAAGANSTIVTLTYRFNVATSVSAFYQRMQGDNTAEFSASGTGCQGSLPASWVCQQNFYVNYQAKTPGTRSGVFGLADNSGNPLSPIPSFGIDLAGDLSLFPGTVVPLSETTPFPTLYEPQGLAVTGNGGELFVADEGGQGTGGNVVYLGKLYDYSQTNGTVTQIGIGAFQTPTALALNAAGDLYVADFNSGSIYIIPVTNRSITKTMTIPGGVQLTHPIALNFNAAGDLYIGDTGPGASFANTQNPGYIVKVPVGGGPAIKYNYTVGGAPVIFPQALATDTAGNLYIADGGDGQYLLGSVAVVPANGAAPSYISSPSQGLDQPSGLSFDPSNNLYVLDGYNQRILIYPVTLAADGTPTAGTSRQFRQDLYVQGVYTASNMVLWPGAHNLTVAAIGLSTTNTPAKVVTVQSANTSVNLGSPAGPSITVPVTGLNVGNATITFAGFSKTGDTGAFSIPPTVCPNSNTLAPQTECTINITYAPDLAGTTSATFGLAVNGVSNSNTITATGTNQVPQMALTSDATSTTFNRANGPATVTLKNTGAGSLIVTNIALSGSGAFKLVDSTCGSTTSVILGAGASCNLFLYFDAANTSLAFFRSVSTVLTTTDNSFNSTSQSLSFTGYGSCGSFFGGGSCAYAVSGPGQGRLGNGPKPFPGGGRPHLDTTIPTHAGVAQPGSGANQPGSGAKTFRYHPSSNQ